MLAYMEAEQNRYSAGKARIMQTFQAVRRKLALSFADIFPNYCKYGYETYMNR